MVLILVFVVTAIFGAVRAKRRGGGVADMIRYGFVHGLVAMLVVYVIATLGDWWGWFA